MRLAKVIVLVVLVAFPLSLVQNQSHSQEPILLWIGEGVPPEFTQSIALLLANGSYRQTQNPAEAALQITLNPESDVLDSTWIYVPVMPFNTYSAEKISFVDIQNFWQSDQTALNRLSASNVPMTLIITEQVRAAIQTLLGEPAANLLLKIVPPESLLAELWAGRGNAWSLVAFNDLIPELKTLALNEIDIFASTFDAQSYPFTIHIGLSGDDAATSQLADELVLAGAWPQTNRDSSKLTRIVLSGVTAMTRVTAYYMEQLGITHPGDGILPFLQDADLIHTSNEVSFAPNCPTPIRDWASTTFCSDDRYLELLQYIGLDVAELTGNHNNDYGPAAYEHTLQMYEQAGIAYFGGGRTPEIARAAWITEINGNTIAFIGCNKPGPAWAWVSAEQGGAAPCDDEYLQAELGRLSQQVDIVIMSVQDFEFNQYDAPSAQVARFTNFAQWGADVVIGTQAHQPQGFGFVPRDGQPSAFLHHGLGNLFFDQIQRIENREMFLDKLIIYDGKLINTVLFTGIIDDYCCPRPMTGGERRNFLAAIFRASGW